jgi:hypothetical protein
MHPGVLYMAQIAATDSPVECELYHEENPVNSAATEQASHSQKIKIFVKLFLFHFSDSGTGIPQSL